MTRKLTKELALLNVRVFLREGGNFWQKTFGMDDAEELNSSFKMLSKKELLSVIDEVFPLK